MYLKIIIINLTEDKLYFKLKQEPEAEHFSGFKYNKNDNDKMDILIYGIYLIKIYIK